jgi:hypothetical protein
MKTSLGMLGIKKSFILLLVVLLISACGAPAATQAPFSAPASTPVAADAASSALFNIVKADGTEFAVTLDAVKALPVSQITVDGKVQEGPKLLDILGLAGVTDFSAVTLTGTGTSTLTRAQVDDNTILDFNNRGNMKLATTYIPKADWAKDITEIKVK